MMSSKLFDLNGKLALITGSSRGLGFILAKGLGQAGATVVLNGLNEERLNKAVQTLSGEGIKTYGAAFDITQAKQIEEKVAWIENAVGPIDILVNNAGIQIRTSLEEFAEADWRRILDVNLTGAFLTAQQVVKGMIARQSGKIINICSLQSEVGRPTIAPYAASKGGLKMLTRGMTVDWAKHNIQINGVGPGYFITEMTQALADDPEFDTWLKGRTPAGRWGDPQELVGAVIFLASAASSFINGQIIYVDGGVLAAL
jgi:gluconate 5-dehydrogenase